MVAGLRPHSDAEAPAPPTVSKSCARRRAVRARAAHVGDEANPDFAEAGGRGRVTATGWRGRAPSDGRWGSPGRGRCALAAVTAVPGPSPRALGTRRLRLHPGCHEVPAGPRLGERRQDPGCVWPGWRRPPRVPAVPPTLGLARPEAGDVLGREAGRVAGGVCRRPCRPWWQESSATPPGDPARMRQVHCAQRWGLSVAAARAVGDGRAVAASAGHGPRSAGRASPATTLGFGSAADATCHIAPRHR